MLKEINVGTINEAPIILFFLLSNPRRIPPSTGSAASVLRSNIPSFVVDALQFGIYEHLINGLNITLISINIGYFSFDSLKFLLWF